MTNSVLTFTLDGFHNREGRRWVAKGLGIAANARKHAKEHGNAGVWRGDDSFVLYYRDGDKVRQKTWKKAKGLLPEAR